MRQGLTDTIVAPSTPPGQGAIALIRISGPNAIEIGDTIFIGKKLQKQESHTIHFGQIVDKDEQMIDEVLLSLFIAPASYTKENTVEITCHGSDYIVQRIIRSAVDQGARIAQPGEFTMRAFLNGQMDLSQAEAVADLIASDSRATHELALKQMRGGYSDKIKALRQELIDFAALIELELDFGEEDVEFADRDKLKKLILDIQKVILELIQSFQLGNVIKNGVSTVIAGRPNAGKSTLLNALLNEERAIVSEIPGTTRDTVEEALNIRGILFRLIDTAGIRRTQNEIEKMGVDRTMEKIQYASVVVYVFDVTEIGPEQLWKNVDMFLKGSAALTEGSSLILVANKMDLNPYIKPEDYYKDELVSKKNLITASAKNNMNIDYLKEKLYTTVVENKSLLDQTIISNSRHYDALQKTNDSLDAVLKGLDEGVTGDFVAMDIRQALHHLGEITGEIYTDDLLDSIFSRFCIGK
jgi:tRNA modification GTPase